MAEVKGSTQAVGKWSSHVYELSDFLELFQLPQVVKVHEGYHDENEEKTLSVDDVLILHRHETVPKVFAISFQGGEEWGEMSLPLTCAVKVDRVSEQFAKSRLSSDGILEQLSKVRFVRVAENDTEVGFARNDKLKVKHKTVENYGSSFSFILSTLTKPKQVFKVTQNCRATFQAVLDPNEYRIAEVVRKFGLPNYIYMVDNVIQDQFKNSFHESVQRVLKLQKTFTETCVIASTLEDSGSVIKLPTNLEITLRSSVEAENQRQMNAECFGETNNCTRIGNEEITINERADSCVVCEEMAGHAKETETASLQKDQMKREIKKDETGKLQVVIPNNYTPTSLVRALSIRNGIYDFPKATSTERTQESSDSPKTPLYDTPRQARSSQNDGNISAGLFTNQIYRQEYARMDRLKHLSASTSAEDEEADHIYQEITFRELPEPMKDISCSVAKEAVNNIDKIISSNKGKISARRDSAPANLIVGESGQHSNTYQIDRTMTDKSKTLTRKYKTWNDQTNSDETVYENCDFLKARLNSCDFEAKTSPQRRARAGVASLVGSSLGSAISDALLRNNPLAKKAASMEAKIPPQPPPRTSSRKPDILEECEYSTGTGNNSTTSKKKAGQAPLPQPPIASVRRSASAAATIGIVKEKKKFSGRPLPIPKTNSQSVDPREALNRDKSSSTDTLEFTSKVDSEKSLRPKLLVPRKALIPFSAPIKKRCDENEVQDSPPRIPRERKPALLDLRKPASPPKPKVYAGSITQNKSGNELMQGKEQTHSSKRANRSHSMNELDAKFVNTRFVIPDDLRSLGVAEVAECLKELKMEQLVEYFQENQIDGEMLLSLDEDILSEMRIEKFHRLKLVKFIGGWRPTM